MGIPYVVLRSGSKPPSGVDWKRKITVDKPRVYAEKSFSYNGPLGGYFPIETRLGRRDPTTGKPIQIHGDSPLTEAHLHYGVTDFKTCLADILEAIASNSCEIIKIDDAFIYFENLEQNRDAANAHERIVYRIALTQALSPSKRDKTLSGLVEKTILPQDINKWLGKVKPPHKAQLESLIQKAQFFPFAIHPLQAKIVMLNPATPAEIKDEDSINGPQYETIKVHSYENNMIGSDVDTLVIPVPLSLLQQPKLQNIASLFDAAKPEERMELYTVVGDLLDSYEQNKQIMSLINLLKSRLKCEPAIKSYALAQLMLQSIAYEDWPGIISPFEVFYYSLVNALNHGIIMRDLTRDEQQLTCFISFNCVQHAADANFNPSDPEVRKKVGRPDKVLFVTPKEIAPQDLQHMIDQSITPALSPSDSSNSSSSTSQPVEEKVTELVPSPEMIADLYYAKDETDVLSFLKGNKAIRELAYTEFGMRYASINDYRLKGEWCGLIYEECERRVRMIDSFTDSRSSSPRFTMGGQFQ